MVGFSKPDDFAAEEGPDGTLDTTVSRILPSQASKKTERYREPPKRASNAVRSSTPRTLIRVLAFIEKI
jgi:hypothetical protein